MRYSIEAQARLRIKRHRRWLEKARSIYGNKYNYDDSLSNFTTAKGTQVKLRCTKHDFDFEVLPDKHIQLVSGGCKQCEVELKRSKALQTAKEKFLPWFNRNYKGKLKLRTDLGLLTEKVEVECLKHGTIKAIEPTVLMSTHSYGCELCVQEELKLRNRLDLEAETATIQGQIPDGLSLKRAYFNDARGRTEFIFKCDIHGEQKPVTKEHVKRSSTVCIDCGKLQKGYSSYRLRALVEKNSSGRASIIGVMEIEVFGIKGLKVGITTRTLENRYSYFLKEIYFSAKLSEMDAIVLENRIKKHFSDYRDDRILKAGMRTGKRWSGDTEFFWKRKKSKIVGFIKAYLKNKSNEQVDYSLELEQIEASVLPTAKINRVKSTANKPIAVVGVDADTGEVKKEFSSMAEAERHGYRNLSTLLSQNSDRQFSGGLRWFKKESFDPKRLPPVKRKIKGKPFRCVQTGELFLTTSEAEIIMRARGRKVSASKITAVLNGYRKSAGGYCWIRVDPNSDEITELRRFMLQVPPYSGPARG